MTGTVGGSNLVKGREGVGSAFPDDFYPELECQIWLIRHLKLPPQLRFVAVLKGIEVKRNALSEEAKIIAVFLPIPLPALRGPDPCSVAQARCSQLAAVREKR